MADLKLPELGENITQGTVTKILVKSGDTINKGQNILELETDKAVLEVPSSSDGTISEILIKSGAVVKVGQPIFTLTATVGATPTKPEAAQAETAKATPATTVSGGIADMNLPALGENIEKGTVTKILVKVGDVLKKGQNILEIETDKAVLEVPSSSAGLIKEILIKQGAVIKVGQPIFKIEGGAATPSASPIAVNPASAPKTTSPVATVMEVPTPKASVATTPTPIRKDIPAAPSVRLLARELGIDLALVPSSSPSGRISNDDVKAYCKVLNTKGQTY